MSCKIEDSLENALSVTRKVLYTIYRDSTCSNVEEKYKYLEKYMIDATNCPGNYEGDLRHQLSRFKSQLKQRWTAARYTESVFLKRNEEWLRSSLTIRNFKPAKSGRPAIPFEESSERSKRRKTENLRATKSPEELCFAAQMSLRKSGKIDAAHVFKNITNATPTYAKEIRKSSTKLPVFKKLSPTQALSIFIEAELTRRQYNIIRQGDKSRYPCYSILQKEKEKCYPLPQSFTITSICAELDFQSLLNHTAERLCMSLAEVLDRLSKEEKENLKLISKWGCDGSQQNQYKQKFENDSESDANIFQSSFAYLQLVTKINGQEKVVWQNPTPSSSRYCRPIRITFIHETTDTINEEIKYIENKIKALEKTIIETDSDPIIVEHKLLLTMIDGKVCNAVTSNKYTQRCFICGSTSRKFNDLDDMSVFEGNPENERFGLSVLHARIKFFESLLHLSYKLTIKEWQVKKNSVNNKIVEERKKAIQQAFKKEMGLLVDFPKAGFGNSNDGNTSRRFFNDIEQSAAITGIDKTLLYRYKVVLEVISSGLKIDANKFSKYTLDTAKLYVQLYDWYPMPPTVHKILIHGASIISSSMLPVGQLSEEAAEARNKHFKQYRLGFSRKSSRELCNQDIINRLLLRSDPILTSMRPIPKKKTKPFSRETLDMLLPPEIPNSVTDALAEVSSEEDDQSDS